MKIISPVFDEGEVIPKNYTCAGKGVNPHLEIEDVPTDAKSLALTMHDPDVPHELQPDGNFNHWVIWNIAPNTKEIPEDWQPDAIVGRSTRGTNKFVPPCPPYGTHRYYFRIYALDTILDLDENNGREELETAMVGHVLDKAEIFGIVRKED